MYILCQMNSHNLIISYDIFWFLMCISIICEAELSPTSSTLYVYICEYCEYLLIFPTHLGTKYFFLLVCKSFLYIKDIKPLLYFLKSILSLPLSFIYNTINLKVLWFNLRNNFLCDVFLQIENSTPWSHQYVLNHLSIKRLIAVLSYIHIFSNYLGLELSEYHKRRYLPCIQCWKVLYSDS